MPATTLNVTTSNPTTGKIKTSAITYCNPNAADSDLTTFVAALAGLSDNTVTQIQKIVRSDLDLPVTAKSSPNLTASPSSAEIDTETSVTITITRSGNGALTITDDATSGLSYANYTTETTATGALIHLPTEGYMAKVYYDITVTCAETDDYTSDSTVINITVPAVSAEPSLPDPEG